MAQPTCGVNPHLYRAYNFEDHIWWQNQHEPRMADYLAMAQRAVKINNAYWMKKITGSHWIMLPSMTDAEKEAVNTWWGTQLPTGTAITPEMIHSFFNGVEIQFVNNKASKINVGSCPNIYQKIVVPMGPQFVEYDNHHYLNTWYNDMIESRAEHAPLGRMVLMMIYGGLCNGTIDKTQMAAESERIEQQVLHNNYDNQEFRFLMNWLAAVRQRPGINLQTNVWLLGTLEGLGKGTLVDIMRHVIGREFVGTLNQTEIEAGWNDHLMGKQLVEINEFDTDGRMSPRAWGKWIKTHTIEPTFKVRQRNTTSYAVMHIGNFIGTSNVEEQSFIDQHDRRNQFIKTSDDAFWVQYATALQIKYFKQNPEAVASGFAGILDQVQVDLDFVSRSFKNQFRQTIVGHNATIIEEWVGSDATVERNRARLSTDWYEDFKTWWRTAHPSDAIPSMTRWGRVMGQSEHLGAIRIRTNTGVQYSFGEVTEAPGRELSEGVAAINAITGDSAEIQDYDLAPDDMAVIDTRGMTQMEILRARLKKQG